MIPSGNASTDRATINPALKLALEFGPLVIFFFTNARGQYLIDNVALFSRFEKPIFAATAIFMVAISLSLAISYILTRRLAVMPLVSGILVLIFGGLTLWLADDTFIKVKPTIINTLFGTVLVGGLFSGRLLLRYVFDGAFHLKEEGWRLLTWRWSGFFFFLAVLNEIIWRTQSTDFWVLFKVWGNMPITLVFAAAQIPLMQRYAVEESEHPDPGL